MRSGLSLNEAYKKAGFVAFDIPKENDDRPFITLAEVKRRYWR